MQVQELWSDLGVSWAVRRAGQGQRAFDLWVLWRRESLGHLKNEKQRLNRWRIGREEIS
jgi:hypothetical protein